MDNIYKMELIRLSVTTEALDHRLTKNTGFKIHLFMPPGMWQTVQQVNFLILHDHAQLTIKTWHLLCCLTDVSKKNSF